MKNSKTSIAQTSSHPPPLTPLPFGPFIPISISVLLIPLPILLALKTCPAPVSGHY
ncbi:hypothetical protein L873DRAFT_1815998 [Choiromyces venosus 120613-1]|uniref:Uncharacterized protein n=1 Tax=Choiromyces venosus 120613-1 TaxID=1336337 RepID=A0A3N4J4W0_9PEZI|nr:hypothetical protein L873DRAFT_1815998 [Choiromyces venosus 120613-1]